MGGKMARKQDPQNVERRQEPPKPERIHQAWGGDEDARNEVAGWLLGELMPAAHRRLGGPNAGFSLRTGDLASETMLAVLKNVAPNEPSELLRWAHRIMINHLKDYIRKRNAAFRSAARPVSLDSGMLERLVEDCRKRTEHDLETLCAAIDQLEFEEPELAEIVNLRFFLGCKRTDIAEQFKKYPVWVERMETRALARLRCLLNPVEAK
jgi:RNA polymerase sigma factor (sigma-70 family)